MKLKKGKGLRFGYYSNSPDFLDLLSFQTTLVIDAKITKMCCTAKENTCFFLSDRLLLSFRWFNCLAEILLIFGRNKLCPLFVDFTIGHNPFLPLAWPTKRGRELSVERDFGKSASCHISVYWSYFLRYGFRQDNFSDFSFSMFFLLLGVIVKAALFVVGEVGAIQVVINPSPVYLRHLRLVWQSRRKSTRLTIAASPKGRLRTFPLPSLSL